jgi:hypothetical protein
MKSIKEKSEENLEQNKDEILCVYDRYAGFVDGANYVLEEIENVIKSDRILGHPFPSLEMRYNQIINVIEQLKK